jgi:RHS repeat-associated protein
MSDETNNKSNDKGQGKGKKFSRRDFLKLSVAGIGGVILHPIVVHAQVFSELTTPPDGSIVVDEDNHIGSVRLDGPSQYWWQRDEKSCIGGKMRYTFNTPNSGPVRMNWVYWETPPLPVDGEYSIWVYIPLEYSNTIGANYQLKDSNDNTLSSYIVDQSASKGKWVEIAKNIAYTAGDIGRVYLDDVIPEAPDSRWTEIGVDAMVWLPPGVNWEPGSNLIFYDPYRALFGLPWWSGIAGEPVATSLGYFYTQHRDLLVQGPGLSVEFTRAYNSLNEKQGLFGRGWTSSYDMNAQDRGNGEIILTFANGRAGLYVPNGSGQYTRPDGFFADLEKQGNEWLLTEVDGTRYKFDSRGKPIEITDPNNNSIKVAYKQDGFKITDAVGRLFTVQNNDNGYIRSIVDPLGRMFTYEYEDDKLVNFTDAMGGSIRYEYDGERRLSSITDPNGHTFVNNEYDGDGRVVVQRDASGTKSTFVYSDKHTVFTDNLGHKTTYEFDDQLRLIAETDHLGHSIVYGYDKDNNRVYMKDREGHETHMEYDERGNLLKVVDGLTQESIFRYNNLNKTTYKRDASGAETAYQYDQLDFNLIMMTDAEGGQTFIEYFENGLIKNLKNPNGDSTHFTYDTYGNLETTTDALDHVTRYEHDIVGRRVRMVDANSHEVQFEYDGNDRVRIITDPKSKTTRFDYDAVGNLKKSVDRRGNTTHYEYNENDSLVRVTDPRGFASAFDYDVQYHRTSFTNRRNFITRYEYDEVYNLAKIIDAKEKPTLFEYDADRNLIRAVDAKGGETRYEYDALHRLKKTTNAIGGVTEYAYDAVGRVTERRDPNIALIKYEYDRLGRLKLVRDAFDNPTNFTYDAVGNRKSMINARSFTTEYRYNAINQLVEQIDPLKHSIKWDYDGVGNVLIITDRRGNMTYFEYDETDNLKKVTDALNGVSIFEYDEEGNRVSSTDQNGHTRVFNYDEGGNLTSMQLPLGQVTRFEYDENGNQIRVTNAKQNATTFVYDPLDLLESRITPMGHQTTYTYDELRHMVRMVDAEGNPTGYEYDPLGRMTAVIDALNNMTSYEYDPMGNLTKHVDANNHATTFAVDLLGRVMGETNPEANAWAYKYDEVGNRVQRKDANNQLTKYEFDADNRLARILYPNGSSVEFEYDPNDNMVMVKDLSGVETFAYDELNRLKQNSHAGKILKNKSLEYSYDAVGNRLQVKYPEKGAVRYEYNENDWLVASLDPLASPRKYAYKRDDLGLPTRVDYPNATWTDYSYDTDDRLVRQFNGKPKTNTDIISSFEYTLDKVGRRRRTVEQFTRGQAVTWTKDYEYDPIYRLRKAVETPDKRPYQSLTSEFDYDAVGNRIRQITNVADKPNTPALPGAKTTEYGYDRANRLLRAGETVYGYDNNGNRTMLNGKERAIEYGYDYENRLVGAQTYDVLKGKRNADAKLDFTYDGLGRRRERGIVERGTRKAAEYLYDGLGYDLLAQYVQPGSSRATHYYRDPMQVLSRQELQGTGAGLQYFHHYDGLGSVSAWTNQAGKEVQEYTYAPYGRLIDNNGPDNASNRTDPHNAMAFSGKLWDRETETYNFGARDYDPAVGLWLTQDSYRGRPNEPMTLHRYGYVSNNPINWVDRYGFYGETNILNANSFSPLMFSNNNQFNFQGNLFSQTNLYTPMCSIFYDPRLKSMSGGTKSPHEYPINSGIGFTLWLQRVTGKSVENTLLELVENAIKSIGEMLARRGVSYDLEILYRQAYELIVTGRFVKFNSVEEIQVALVKRLSTIGVIGESLKKSAPFVGTAYSLVTSANNEIKSDDPWNYRASRFLMDVSYEAFTLPLDLSPEVTVATNVAYDTTIKPAIFNFLTQTELGDKVALALTGPLRPIVGAYRYNQILKQTSLRGEEAYKAAFLGEWPE